MIVATTVAVRTRAMSSPSPLPSSLSAWASSLSPRPLHPLPFPQRPLPQPVTPATAYFPCHSGWVFAWITTRAGYTFTMPTPWGAFMRGRWIVQERCIRPLASWAVAWFNWRSSSQPRNWPSEDRWGVLTYMELHLLSLWHVLGRAGFIPLLLLLVRWASLVLDVWDLCLKRPLHKV